MSILDHLITFQSDFRTCETIAYADLSSKMVLCSTSLVKMRQEQLDALCASAVDFLEPAGAQGSPVGLLSAPKASIENAVVVSGNSFHIFVRSPIDNDEAICCICLPDTDTARFTSAARNVLVQLEASS